MIIIYLESHTHCLLLIKDTHSEPYYLWWRTNSPVSWNVVSECSEQFHCYAEMDYYLVYVLGNKLKSSQ